MPDVRAFWASDPSIALLATYLHTRAELDPLDGYRGLALVAHSMGGLVVQQALLDHPDLADRVSHVFMFGTPSNGLRVARWAGFLKRQVRDMAEGGPYITELRSRWDEAYGERRPFKLWVVAGDRDMFVPASSALHPFPKQNQLVVPGDHLELVDVGTNGSMSTQVVAEGLLGAAAPAGPWNSARVAVESSEYDHVIRELGAHAGELDEQHLIDLAIALEATGRGDEAITVLTEHAGGHRTDAKGTLAGRIKRRWLDDGRQRDAESALELYSEGLGEALEAGDAEQAYYHAINVAFLELVSRRDRAAAGHAAEQARDACSRAPLSYWSLATQAEADLYFDRPEQALEAYRAAVALQPSTRELESTYLQAGRLIDALGHRDLREPVELIFRDESSTSAAGRT